MTASIFIRQQVNDFATWKKTYEEMAPRREESGVIVASVHRDADDPNTIIAYSQYADLSTAQGLIAALSSNEEFQAVLKKSGVKPETMEVWVSEDV
jgi:quinol monooxygenase YgiN